MRVTDSMIYNVALRDMGRAKFRIAKAQEQSSSGNRVTKPSDDPIASAIARRETGRITEAEGSKRTTTVGTSALSVTDAALQQVQDAIVRARELATQAANTTYTASDRTAIAQEVEQLRQQIINLGNTQDGEGRYVFAGYRDNAPAFDPASGSYQGDGMVRELEVSPNVRVAAGISGTQAFSSTVDIMRVMSDFRDALNANDVGQVAVALDNLNVSTNQVSSARAAVGARMNSFEVFMQTAQNVRDRALQSKSELIEADPFDAFSELQRAQYALQAAVQVASILPLPSLAQAG